MGKKFDGFGPSSIASAFDFPTSSVPLHASKEATRRSIREHCPALPGVYGMIGVGRELIYVGESKSLRHRLLSYFTGEPPSSRVRRLVGEARHLVWETTGHKFTALLRELECIRRWRPRFNVRGKPGRTSHAYLCIGRGPAPQVHLSSSPSARKGWTFGPVPAGRAYRQSVRRLNDCFGLRDCRSPTEITFSEQIELLSQHRESKCVRGAVGKCLAPCAADCSQAEYADRIAAALDFLAGRDTSILARLGAEMRSASDGLAFELAARLRDANEDLARLFTFLGRLREARRCSLVYPARGFCGKENWYLIREGEVRAVARGPRNARASQDLLKALDAVFPPGDRTCPSATPDDLDVVLLVSRWFREQPGELAGGLSPDEARTLCY